MKLNLKFNSKNTNIKNISSFISHVWEKTHTLIFFVVLFTAIAIGGYIWQRNINSGEWSNEKKQEYISTQNKEVIFKEKDFQKILNDISSRKDEYLKEHQPIKNIFKPY